MLKNISKRIVSWLLILILCINLLPWAALATEVESETFPLEANSTEPMDNENDTDETMAQETTCDSSPKSTPQADEEDTSNGNEDREAVSETSFGYEGTLVEDNNDSLSESEEDGNEPIPQETKPDLIISAPDHVTVIPDNHLDQPEIPNVFTKRRSFAASNEDEISRYTVLLLDVESEFTMSSNGTAIYSVKTPLDTIKAAANKFVEQVQKADGKNHVAVVSYSSSVNIESAFSSDENVLNSAINNLTVGNFGANIGSAFETADSLLSQVTDENAIKNIVLFTQGVCMAGQYSTSGSYNSNDCSWYRSDNGVYIYQYSNYAHTVAKQLMEKYNLYTIGLFQSFDSVPEKGQSLLTFACQFSEELQNKGFYNVDDVNDLEFVFGEAADDVTSDKSDKDPIIVIPGIMGSRFFTSNTTFDDSTRIWDPVLSVGGVIDMTKLGDRLVNGTALYVRPCEKQNDLSTNQREYGAQDTYKEIVDNLCDAFPNRDVYVFSYDWRNSNSDSADKLDEFIDTLGDKKVDLVCHSMGGLVASSYYSRYASEGKVDKIITCGTPYEGAPKLINSVQNWDILGEGFWGVTDFFLGALGGLQKDVKSSFLGVAELTPTKNYINRIPMQKDSAWPFSLGDYNLTYDEYANICKSIFGSNFTNAQSFQNSILSNGFNALLTYDNSYFIVGINHKTISSIKFQYSTNDVDQRLYESDVEYSTQGDGTVPFYSSSISEKILSLDSKRYKKADVDHSGTIGHTENSNRTNEQACIEWIIDILKDGMSSVGNDPEKSNGYTVVRIACPVDVSISTNGESLTSNPNDLGTNSSFGRLDILGENDEIKMLCIDTGDDYDLVLNGTDSGTMDYAVRFFNQNGILTDERMFEDVPIAEDTVIKTNTNPDVNSVLEVDSDGDGIVDQIWTASTGEWITTDDNSRIPLDSICFDEIDTLEIGQTVSASIKNNPIDSTDKIVVSFSSSDSSIVSVDKDGNLTALSIGHVTITAKATNGLTATIDVDVADHTFDDNVDGICNICGANRADLEIRQVTHMLRMYNPYTGEHFYTGSEEERDNLVAVGWNYEGVAFTFPGNTGAPVYRLYDPATGEHLYTMDEEEKAALMAEGWNYEGIAFNSAYDTEAVQHRLHNPYATVGAYHFTFSDEEKQNLINAGWEYQGIGWYSCWK